MKIALAQINQVVGDFDGNLRRIEKALLEAERQGADLCVFPEMATTGCYAKDLLLQDRFISDNLDLLDKVAERAQSVGVVIGYVRYSRAGRGLENAAALICGGEIVSTHVKTRLTVHGELDERRYFVPGESVAPADFEGVRLGILFSDDHPEMDWGSVGQVREANPAAAAVRQGAEILLDIGAQPYRLGATGERLRALSRCAIEHHRPLLHINLLGGNEEWVFDGTAVAFDPRGEVIAAGAAFREGVTVVDVEAEAETETEAEATVDGAVHDVEGLMGALTLGTRDFIRKHGRSTAAVVLGGDPVEAVAAVVTVDALGPDNVTGLVLSTGGSDEAAERLSRATAVATAIGIRLRTVDMGGLATSLRRNVGDWVTSTLVRTPERLDQTDAIAFETVLHAICRLNGDVLVSAKNLTDAALATLPAIEGDFAPFQELTRSQLLDVVAYLASERGIPKEALVPLAATRSLSIQVGDGTISVDASDIDRLLERFLKYGYAHPELFSLGLDDAVVRWVVEKATVSRRLRCRGTPGISLQEGSAAVPAAHRWNPVLSSRSGNSA